MSRIQMSASIFEFNCDGQLIRSLPYLIITIETTVSLPDPVYWFPINLDIFLSEILCDTS